VDLSPEAIVGVNAGETQLDLEAVFAARYARVARVIAKVIRDPARAEELAVEVFLKWSRKPKAQGVGWEGWLYRTAVRTGLDELRRQTRRGRYESLVGLTRSTPTPEEIHSSQQEQERVRAVLAALHPRQAEMLLLRSEDLSYGELAGALDLNPASVGTLLSRAQEAFRKEYIKKYGEQ
jgi:RNA polymerase sigma-70 factor (ECF subfamily)